MKEIPLSQNQVAIVDDDDYAWLSQWKWSASWNPLTRSFYAVRRIAGSTRMLLMHREILGFSDIPEFTVDHRDVDSLNNRRQNLRPATIAQNTRNQKLKKNNSSGFKGVHFPKDKKRWMAYITYEWKRRHIGYYDTAEEAARAYDVQATKLFGDFARLNFPLDKAANA